MPCVFCEVAAGSLAADIVFQDALCTVFLDYRPVFPGHVLCIPNKHFETLADLPSDLTGPLFERVKQLEVAVESALGAEGTFIAVNNRVSQSVPHLHVHIIPRRKKDGLKGFFWPRRAYASDEERQSVRDRIRAALQSPMAVETE